MLNAIRQYFWKRRRLIFRFNNGSKIVATDPIEIATAIHAHPMYLPQHLFDAASGDHEAQRIVAKTACDVFGVEKYNGCNAGMTVAERIELMMAFNAYMHALKKNIEVYPMLPDSTASTSPSSSAPTTEATSAYGSTGTAPACEPRTSLEPA